MSARGAPSSSEPDSTDLGVPSSAFIAASRPSSFENRAWACRRFAARRGRPGEPGFAARPWLFLARRPRCRCARVSQMKLSTPLGCHEESPRLRRDWQAAASMSNRSPPAAPPAPLEHECPGEGAAAAPCLPDFFLAFDSGVQPVWSDMKKSTQLGDGASRAAPLSAIHGSAGSCSAPTGCCSAPSSSLLGCTGLRVGVATCGAAPSGGMLSMSAPPPKLRASRKARMSCWRLGPSFFGISPRTACLSPCPAEPPASPAGAGLVPCLRPGDRVGPNARCWHSSEERPTLAAICCQKWGVLGLTSPSAALSLRVSSSAHAPEGLCGRFRARRSPAPPPLPLLLAG
mmetsp:Transcript_94100/g.249854  ORF Transcript_94100/g.249854 Transcript_94100/m.249854 type:complete len:344 (-) Transcript_94100:668-1699(-)